MSATPDPIAEEHQTKPETDEDWEDDELTSVPYEMWWWDCPACMETNDARDLEPSGPETCSGCGRTIVVKR